MTIGDFPGFNAVLLSHTMLKTIIREANPSWRTALANVSGVYVITDTSTGKMYVGMPNDDYTSTLTTITLPHTAPQREGSVRIDDSITESGPS